MKKTMKAAVWVGDGKVEIRELPVPSIGKEEALLKVRAAGVCVTDYHIISGKLRIGQPPNVQGHEICGEVVAIDTARTDIPVGQRCVVATSLGCGHCEYCREGKQYICRESGEIGYYPYHGGYAEYVKVPVSAIVPIPDEVSDETAAILESSVCPTESLMRVGIPFAGTVFVAGAGPAGLAFIKVAKLLGAGKIVCLVRGEQNAGRALKFGATHVVDSTREDVVSRLSEITGGEMADVTIEATGAPSVVSETPYYTKKGGKIILYGIPGDDETVSLPIKKLICEEMTVYGAVGNTKAWYPLVRMIADGKLDIGDFVTHRFRLEDINEAFALYAKHDKSLIKAVIRFDGEREE
ncbi:MAG: alcohol dehydrogenase catalytic domain-containing protein [Candidatus Borkfalkiaceae bacterium]|nr:alcohol dehydrogenase catalytic domain-containing protein [Christensenellaceae bacterium]